jgi:hypothetical protein
MPVYNAPLLEINQKETRRYAGLMKATFDEDMIASACLEARLLAKPQGIWQIYDYDAKNQIVLGKPSFTIKGGKIGFHLAGAEKVILLAVTVGEDIENTVTKHFNEGHYAFSMLLDAAATTAVEQIADAMEKTIQPKAEAQGYNMRWRFSPGYGDWPIEQQPELIRLSQATTIGISLTESMMLIPRKSITAIIGLIRENPDCRKDLPHGCAACNKKDCLSRYK